MNSKNDLEIPFYLFMFRKQQKAANSGQQIKSFSSRVGKRGVKKEEEKPNVEEVEKKEEEVEKVKIVEKSVSKPVVQKSSGKKSVPQRGVAKKEVLPVLRNATTIGIDQYDSMELVQNDGSNPVTYTLEIKLKPLVGDYVFNNEEVVVQGDTYNCLIITISGTIEAESISSACIIIPSYHPTTSDANLVPNEAIDFTHIKLVYDGGYSVIPKATESITIKKLYLVNSINDLPSADGENSVFVPASENESAKIRNISGLSSYISCTIDHSDVEELHTTNWLYKRVTGENVTDSTGSIINNIAVKGEIPSWIYNNLGLPLRLRDSGGNNLYPIIPPTSNEAAAYEIHSFNDLPTPQTPLVIVGSENSLVNATSINLSGTNLGENDINIVDKFKNFYVNNVTVAPSTSSNIISQFTQTIGTEYLGSTVTIMKAGNTIELPARDPLVPLIKNIKYEDGVLTFTIKPNNLTNILSNNRVIENGTINSSHILIDLTSSSWNNVINNIPSSDNETGREISFVQEAVILHDEWDNNGEEDENENNQIGPDVRLNGSFIIKQIDIKYIKTTTTNDVTTNSIEVLEFSTTNTSISSTINNLYLVNGKVEDNLLSTLNQNQKFAVVDNVHYIQNVSELISEDDIEEDQTISTGQVCLYCVDNIDKLAEGSTTEHITEHIPASILSLHTINMICQRKGSSANLVISGEIPSWVLEDFTEDGFNVTRDANTADKWIIAQRDLTTSKTKKNRSKKNVKEDEDDDNSLFIAEFNALPVTGFEPDLNIGIKRTGTDEEGHLSEGLSIIGNSNNYLDITQTVFNNQILYENFHLSDIYVNKGDSQSIANIQMTGPNEFIYEGTVIHVKSNDGNNPSSDSGYIKIKTLDELYNLMIEPRQLDENGILKDEPTDVPENDITTKVLEEGYYLHYSPTLAKGLERLVINRTESNADGYFSVRIKCERLTEAEETEPALYRIYLEYTNQGVTHIIPYGVIGNGAFTGSQLDPRFEVNGNKYNLKIESIMNGINEREIEEVQGKLELSNKAKTDESVKIKKSEMYEYICEMKRTFQVMAYNMRYINEVLGYLSKCLAFEEIRLPSIRESDNQGLESVNEEYDSETNPNGWIEKYTEEFVRNDILYKVTPSYENYRFKEGGKHDNLIRDMQNKVNQIYMYYTLSEGNNEALGLDYTMTVMINEFMDIWMKYYKGLVVPNNVIISEYSDIEIYEDEHIYKVFEGDEEGVHIISKLTDGRSEDTDGEELKKFIEELMMYFKDEINEITGNKKEIKSVTIEDTVAYADPLKEYTDSNVDENESIDNVLTNNENNLIEYSQMLSTIQGERNKLQRQGNKNKFILKFTQTVKGTFFEMFGKEKVNTDSKSIIFGFFISELQRVINHIVQNREMRNADRKAKRGIRHEVSAIPEQIDGKWYLRITKIPEFYKGDPLDWINDSYYSNKIFLQNCDNLYVGIDPELDQRIFPVGTPKDNNSSEFKEQEMIGYYILKVNY